MTSLVCSGCGLAYHASTLPQHLLGTSGASCPRCAAPLLTSERPEQDRRQPPRVDSTRERHRAAVERTLGWAEQAAAEEDYSTALAWLATIEAIDNELPQGFNQKRERWASRARAAATRE